jgi:hypothetical protein
MGTAFNILTKVFTHRFYVRNTGFFLLLFYLLFGTVESSQLISYHRSLMEGFLFNRGFLFLVLGCWLGYNLKCVDYVLTTLSTRGYEFLYNTLGACNTGKRRGLLLCTQLSIYFPVLLYSGIAVVVAVYHKLYITVGIITVFNLLMCILPVWLYERKLRDADITLFSGYLNRWLNKHFSKPWSLYYLWELLTGKTRMLLVTKLLSGAVLLLTFGLMGKEEYDIRMVLLGILLCTIAHITVIFENRNFDDQQLLFVRNLPLSLTRKYLSTGWLYFLLFLPEYMLVVVNARPHLSPVYLTEVFLLAFSLLLLFRSLLYFATLDPDKHLRWVLLIAFVLLFMILARWQLLAIVLLQVAAIWIFFKKYPEYEPVKEAIQ